MQEIDVAKRLQRWTAISSLALLAVTYRLWIPQTVFPQVPAFAMLCVAPAWCDWICLGCLIAGLVSVAMGRSGYLNICGSLLVLGSLLGLFCLDQHRFQPWAYQLCLFTAIGLCCGIRVCLSWMRWLLISIYFYSALGKFDFEFLHTVGQQMLGALVKLFGLDVSNIPAWLRLALVVTFSLAELAVAAGLAWSKSSRVAGLFAIGLHLTLIIILGPLGLNHRPGVLIWNAQFAVQAYLLFVVRLTDANDEGVSEPTVAPEHSNRWKSYLQTCCAVLIAAVIALPITERFGIWDHWPSWALYAPHSSRVRVEVAAPSIQQLPEELIALIDKPTPEAVEMLDWVFIPIDAWSLRSLDTPIYPQARFQLGVALQIASEVDTDGQVRITVFGSANRFTGRRQSEVFEGAALLDNVGAKYWLNFMPRQY